ncbi:MAG TPA: LysM peptidoglycan-binding domain-containing protein [Opitutaceae bacterium]|nr:LysM peptidoglycan-binding domain-containing protein [Opitutaceae bacterium]
MRIVGLFGLLVATAFGQIPSPQVELANLREDMRVLSQRVGELNLRVEQLERDNAALQRKSDAGAQAYATVVQLNDALAATNLALKNAVASAKAETLQQVAAQMEKLAQQTNAAIDSLAKGMATRPSVVPSFSEDYPKEGIRYTVQKGETLAQIAKKNGAKMQDVINANKIVDPTRLQAGQTLFIPIPGAK